MLMDLSMRRQDQYVPDITQEQVASAGGKPMHEISQISERAEITRIITAGATKLTKELFKQGGFQAIMGIGGSTGTLMATDVMRALPFGVPKLMISSTAALPGLSTRYIGKGDIMLFHSVIEISGLSAPLKNVIDRAVHAISGMISDEITPPRIKGVKSIAMTMLGPCEGCASRVRAGLEESGYEVIGFSAAGIGDRAMEDMIKEGMFDGVVDLAPGGVGEHYYGFMRDAGPDRLESAGKVGIPQVISTCSVNHMTPAKSKYKPEFHERRKYDLDRFRTWVRHSPDELEQIAQLFIRKLNMSKSLVKIVIPLRGWSSVDKPGAPTYDPEEDMVFVRTLKAGLRADIEIIEVDANMEDPEFSSAIIDAALEVFGHSHI
jgi:uncharacterized protein (UPF0261 family)